MKICLPVLLLALQACGTSGPLLHPTTEDVRSRMRSVRVVDLSEPAQIVLDVPSRGWLAAIPGGACDVASALWDIGGQPGADQAALLALLAPLGLVIGAVYGPIAALPVEEIDQGVPLLRAILQERGSGFASLVREEAQATGVRLDPESEESIVLIAGAASVALTGEQFVNPWIRPIVTAKVRLESREGRILYQGEVRHSGVPRSFSEWTTHRDQLGQELDEALRRLAEKVVAELFLVVPPPEP